jgi:hypothetical protein
MLGRPLQLDLCVAYICRSVATLRLGGDTVAPRPETVRCAACGCRIGEDEAQAVRWALWSAGLDAYPFCEPCATREFDFSGNSLRIGAPEGRRPLARESSLT